MTRNRLENWKPEDLPRWDPVENLAPAMEWLNTLMPEQRKAIKLQAKRFAADQLNLDIEEVDRVLSRFEEENTRDDVEPTITPINRWYCLGIIHSHHTVLALETE